MYHHCDSIPNQTLSFHSSVVMTATSMQMHKVLASGRDSGHLAPPRDNLTRKRSNSQSQVISTPVPVQARSHTKTVSNGKLAAPKKSKASNAVQERHQAEFYVTLVPLNDTFVRKHIHVPYFPDLCKLGRPTGLKVKPSVSNGYFDLRVLSRNHACLFVEPKLGQLMIQDMGSSNGTYVNQEKIGTEPVPINIGDRVNLGFNIQVETSHKQISAVVEDINIVSNTPSVPALEGMPKLTPDAISKLTGSEKRHLDFIQDVYEQIQGKKKEPEEDDELSEFRTTKAFEQGMFSDVTPCIDDVFTASTADPVSSGIFVNSRLTKPNDLETTLDTLIANLAKVKQQTNSLRSLESFLGNYRKKLHELNEAFLNEENKKREACFDQALEQQLTKYEAQIDDHKKDLDEKSKVMSFLLGEVERLQYEKADLRKELEDKKNILEAKHGNGLAPLDNQDSLSRRISIDISSFDFGTGKLIKNLSSGSEEVDEISNSSDIGSEDLAPKAKLQAKLESPEGAVVKNPQMGELFEQANQFRTKGVAVGLVVILAGFVYQSCER